MLSKHVEYMLKKAFHRVELLHWKTITKFNYKQISNLSKVFTCSLLFDRTLAELPIGNFYNKCLHNCALLYRKQKKMLRHTLIGKSLCT